jgi:hypothetical protein
MNNSPKGFLIDSVSVGFGTVTNKYTLQSFRFKFRQSNSFDFIETLTTEHLEVGDIRLVSGEYFIWSLVQAPAEIEPV